MWYQHEGIGLVEGIMSYNVLQSWFSYGYHGNQSLISQYWLEIIYILITVILHVQSICDCV